METRDDIQIKLHSEQESGEGNDDWKYSKSALEEHTFYCKLEYNFWYCSASYFVEVQLKGRLQNCCISLQSTVLSLQVKTWNLVINTTI